MFDRIVGPALGARPADILGLILGQGFRLVACGLLIGTAASLVADICPGQAAFTARDPFYSQTSQVLISCF